jgi:CheY-like chemotaxis protein
MGGTLLLADDSITIQKVVELTFAETEHAVVAVGNGRDLLARLEQVRPDVILCDVVMPDLNGYDICQRIKSDPATLHIPVVLLTGTFEPFDRDRALASGCDAIITKPFEAKELIATVEDLLQRAQTFGGEGAADGAGGPGDFSVPDGVQGIDFTTTGFERMVPPPPKTELPPVDGVEMTLSSFQSQISAPAPPPPELADDSGADLGRRPPAAAPAEPVDDLIAASPEDQTTPSGPTPTAEERRAAAMALLEAVSARSGGAIAAPAPPAAAAEPDPFAEPAPEPVAAPPAAAAPRPVAPPTPAVPPTAAAKPAAPAPAPPPAAIGEPAAGAMLAASRELSQDEVDRIARRVLELAEPLIERIAWEVIPDMAEMMVRQRIRELEEAAEEDI